MKKLVITGLLAATLLGGGASARAAAAPLYINGTAVESAGSFVVQQTTYAPLRTVLQALRPDAEVWWEADRAMARGEELEVSARPGEAWMEINGRLYYVPHKVRLLSGRTMVPVRALAEALGATVEWEAATGAVHVTGGGEAAEGETAVGVQEEDLYWLSRIISAESRGEPLEGQIAVGNVVLNRVASDQFPDSVYEVIFDSRWGGQFTPVSNGTIYHTPAESSVQAARLCLTGANTAGDSLYFLAPALADSHWIMANRTYVTTIGSHCFYR